MITLIPKDINTNWCVYKVLNSKGEVIFLWHAKLTKLLTLYYELRNPAFDQNEPVTIIIDSYYSKCSQATAAFTKKLAAMQHYPSLNKTVQHNIYGNYVCNETGEKFLKQVDIAKKLDVSVSLVSNYFCRSANIRSIKGFTFQRLDFIGNDNKPFRRWVNPVPYAERPMTIRCNETGQLFRTQAEIARVLDVERSRISKHLKLLIGHKTINGLSFSFIENEQ